jgi:hypothetical protein
MKAWTGLIWLRGRDRWRALVSAVTNLQFPWKAGNFLTIWDNVSFSRRTLLHAVSQLDVTIVIPLNLYPHWWWGLYQYNLPLACNQGLLLFMWVHVLLSVVQLALLQTLCDVMMFHLMMIGRYRCKWVPMRICERIFHSKYFVWLKPTFTHCVGRLAIGR